MVVILLCAFHLKPSEAVETLFSSSIEMGLLALARIILSTVAMLMVLDWIWLVEGELRIYLFHSSLGFLTAKNAVKQ